jgi:hypothetical protein
MSEFFSKLMYTTSPCTSDILVYPPIQALTVNASLHVPIPYDTATNAKDNLCIRAKAHYVAAEWDAFRADIPTEQK